MIGRIALVTGAAGDLGRAAAVRLAGDGAIVVACDLTAKVAGLDATIEA